MCGRYSLDGRARSKIEELFAFNASATDLDLWDRYNIAPSQQIPVLRLLDHWQITPMTWGFVPSYVKDEKPKAQPVNARAETVATSPYFRTAFRRQRCLVPASGYYEWQAMPDGKQPYNIYPIDGRPFLMAAIWDRWHDADRVAIVTTSANAAVEAIHNRMPVMIDYDVAREWISGATPEAFLHPAPVDQIAFTRVSRRVNNTRNQGPDLLQAEP